MQKPNTQFILQTDKWANYLCWTSGNNWGGELPLILLESPLRLTLTHLGSTLHQVERNSRQRQKEASQSALSSEQPLELNPPGSPWETMYIHLRLRSPLRCLSIQSHQPLAEGYTQRVLCSDTSRSPCSGDQREPSGYSKIWPLEMLSAEAMRDRYQQGLSERHKHYLMHLTWIYWEVLHSGWYWAKNFIPS